ncbi:hypothetical protein Tco_0775672 [Tanacetum coccineum]
MDTKNADYGVNIITSSDFPDSKIYTTIPDYITVRDGGNEEGLALSLSSFFDGVSIRAMELLFYSDRLEIQHIEASMNSKCILYAANARLNAASSNLPPQNVVSSSSALANSHAFVCPSRTPTSTRFGSALNIETLVAAAEHKETPIDETIKGLGPGCIFILIAIAK